MIFEECNNDNDNERLSVDTVCLTIAIKQSFLVCERERDTINKLVLHLCIAPTRTAIKSTHTHTLVNLIN